MSEIMSVVCWSMVLPSVGLMMIQHVLDGGINTERMGKWLYGSADRVFTYMAINHRGWFKNRVGHAAIHMTVAVVAALTQYNR